ncbi:MAG: hypothetical protein QXP91_09910 [Candidatus Methanomethylicia archaeon]
MENLRRRLLKLLEEDSEFRYTIAGLIGLNKIFESIDRNTEAIAKLLRQVGRHTKTLREHTKAIRSLQEEVKRHGDLLEEHTKAIRSLQEEVKRHGDLLEEHTKAIAGLRVAVNDFGVVIGRTLEDYTRTLIREVLIGKGIPIEKLVLGRKILVYNKEPIEINIFNEEPLIMGEVTTYIGNAEEEIGKIVRRMGIVEEVYGRKVEYVFLAVEVVMEAELGRLKELARKHNIQVYYGKAVSPITLTST